MATILFAWELGQGHGHLSVYRELVSDLHAAGHRVVFVARDVARAAAVLEDAVVLQAPLQLQPQQTPVEATSMPQILLNCGFDDPQGLIARCRAWRWIADMVEPDVIIADHSPTALVAFRGSSVIASGTGFTVPPAGPFKEFAGKSAAHSVQNAERAALRSINDVLREFAKTPLTHLSDLWSDCKQFLLSFEELDPYQRSGAEFHGCYPGGGATPVWADGDGPRVFCYVHPYPGLADLLALLRGAPWRSLLIGPRISDDMQRRFENQKLRFSRHFVDLRALAGQCDAGLTNGSHSTTAALLLSGIPVVVLANHLEQSLTGQAVERLGAGRSIYARQVREARAALAEILDQRTYAERAQAFATRYHADSLASRNARLLRAIEEML